MKPFSPVVAVGIIVVYLTGFFSHLLYQRWNPAGPSSADEPSRGSGSTLQDAAAEPQSHPVSIAPWSPQPPSQAELPVIAARDVEKLRALAGTQARVRGRIFRVGHSAKSNTHFLSFGPSREALTAVIFASALEHFQKKQLPPKNFAGKEVELRGEIKDHPQYGLEIILESPAQIKVLD